MLSRPLNEGVPLPLVPEIDPAAARSLDGALSWAREQAEELEELVSRAGVLLLRGVPIDSASAFRSFCAAIRPDLRNYVGGDSPRRNLEEQVYTSTEYPEDLEVLLHNELSYASWPPDRLFFCCLQPAARGGETQIADGRVVYDRLPEAIRRKFETLGVIYHQHLWDRDGEVGIGKSWQETFETSDRQVVEALLTRGGAEHEWTDFGLRTRARRPAVAVHPRSGEKCWFNQADQWHRSFESVKLSVGARNDPRFDPVTAGEESLGNHVTYGDGGEIDIRDLEVIRAICRDCELLFPWQAGDVMIIDNLLAMHGRKPYQGQRQVLVAMA